MVQTTNRFFDEAARLMNDAAGVAQGVRREFETLFRTQAERILRDLDVVKREDFEAVKDMARLAREENEALNARVTALEAVKDMARLAREENEALKARVTALEAAQAASNAASAQPSPSYAPQSNPSFDAPPPNPAPSGSAPSGGMNETIPDQAPGDTSGPMNPGTF